MRIVFAEHPTHGIHHHGQGSVQVDHLKQPEISKLLDEAKVVYSAGFHITACSEAILFIAEHCLSAGKTYALVCTT
jgi:hypothetical protein